MPTSGSTDFNQNRNEIIRAALRKIGVIGQGVNPSAVAIEEASEDLNRLIKSWNKMGFHLWKARQFVLFVDTTSTYYTLSSTGSYACYQDDLAQTTLSASALSGATSVSITSASGIAISDYIVIVQSDGTNHKTTISNLVGTTVTLASALTADADDDAVVYAFTTKIDKPLRIVQARVNANDTSGSDDSEIVLTSLSSTDYFGLPTKDTTGVPVQFYYQPMREEGLFYIWPVASNISYIIRGTAEFSIEDVDDLDDEADLPPEWLQALVWNLAYEQANEYGVDDSTYMRVESRALATLESASGWDVEIASVQFAPDRY